MDNLSDPYLKDYTFKKRGNIDEYILIYSGIRNLNGKITRVIYLTFYNDDIIGSFSIEGKGIKHQFDSGVTNDMHIYIENCFQGKGLSKIMIKHMIDKIYEDIPDMNREQMIFIDADASDGFWDKIGMVESKRYGYNRTPKYYEREGAGYEKYITINKLYKFAIS
tara:strand:+ start:160 stop:654 length:495 start_codon:yes stop_codon:yes gene_type:complete